MTTKKEFQIADEAAAAMRDYEAISRQIQTIMKNVEDGQARVAIAERHPKGIPPVILCAAECDRCDTYNHLREARRDGWTAIDLDDGPGNNYLGTCPACTERERKNPEFARREREEYGN